MIYSARLIFLLCILCLTGGAQADGSRRLTIQSKADQFELVLNGSNGTVNGKAADLSGFRDLIPLVTDPIANECSPPTGTAEATVKEGGKTRFIYIKQGLVSNGTNCVSVAGEGLFYFPVHRDFLIGAKTDGITLKSPVKFFRQGVKIFELNKNGHGWTSGDSTILLNWDFMERFENSLRSFSVRFRVLPSPGSKPKLIVQSGDLAYEFYKMSNGLWAVKKPKTTWLEASDDWSFWYDLDDAVIEDRFTPQIRIVEDSTKDKAERMAAMEKLGPNWSPNLRELYHKVVLDAAADSELKLLAFKRLKSKPSTETARVMAQYLSEGKDEDFKKLAGQILKINFPKGPLYNPDASTGDRLKVIEFWSQWSAKNKSTH